MRVADFHADAPGRLVPTIDAQFAFVPTPLPPSIDMNDIGIAMADTMQAIGNAKDKFGITYSAAKTIVDRLVHPGILAEVPGLYPKTVIALGVLNAARPDDPDRITATAATR